jgi:hypothetical protein
MLSDEELANRFTYHPPTTGQPEKYEMIRKIAHSYATVLNELVPDSREKSLAMTHLDEVVFWAIAGIARNG